MRDFIWAQNGVIYVGMQCFSCGFGETNDISTSTTVACKHCGQVYYQSIKEARHYYPHARVVLNFR